MIREDNQAEGLKLLVIGLDGATFEVIHPMVARGELPNLAGLMTQGCSGNLESTIPPFSAPAWTSFMTGMNPGKHGIFGFVNYNPLSYTHIDSKAVTATALVGHTFFDALSQAGLRLASITVPITYPAWAINGYMIAGPPCPDTDKGLAYPQDFAADLSQRYTFLSTFWSKDNKEIVAGIFDMVDSRTDLALRLIEEKSLDVMMLVLGATDRAQHNFWRHYDPAFADKLSLLHEAGFEDVIPEAYRRADAAVGRLLSYAGDQTTVLIVSDHGGGPAATRLFHTNAWLRQEGLLGVKRGQDAVATGLGRAMTTVRRGIGAQLEQKLRGLLPKQLVEQGRALVRNVAQLDWSTTQAYRFPMYPPAEGIVINVQGRQAAGIVQPGDEYEQVREHIIGQAGQLIDPASGQQVIVKAIKREELYQGPHLERAPDIVLILEDDYRGGIEVSSPIVTEVNPSSLSKLNGEHRMQGILIAHGPTIRRHAEINNAHIIDMAPTILYSLDLPIPNGMDGVVLRDLFSPDHLESHAIKYGEDHPLMEIETVESELTPEEEEQMKKHLERLGYL
jgi:predicted AlkP superfamily phosphohydrolase/phosphomutase